MLWLTCSGLCAVAGAGLLALGPAIRRRALAQLDTVPVPAAADGA